MTTLINVITGFYKPKKGIILFKGRDITNRQTYHIARMGLVRTFQNINLFSNMTVLENIITGRFSHLKSSLLQVIINSSYFVREKKECQNLADEILIFVGLKGYENIEARALPYGKQRLLEIARALATEPQFHY
jgi:ABC-type branched-subunit amino acid transport system ATPase component